MRPTRRSVRRRVRFGTPKKDDGSPLKTGCWRKKVASELRASLLSMPGGGREREGRGRVGVLACLPRHSRASLDCSNQLRKTTSVANRLCEPTQGVSCVLCVVIPTCSEHQSSLHRPRQSPAPRTGGMTSPCTPVSRIDGTTTHNTRTSPFVENGPASHRRKVDTTLIRYFVLFCYFSTNIEHQICMQFDRWPRSPLKTVVQCSFIVCSRKSQHYEQQLGVGSLQQSTTAVQQRFRIL